MGLWLIHRSTFSMTGGLFGFLVAARASDESTLSFGAMDCFASLAMTWKSPSAPLKLQDSSRPRVMSLRFGIPISLWLSEV
jgi:hypothetical protein